MGKLIAICVSEKKGTAKKTVDSAILRENYGIEGDAHAGIWHRQVSLLGRENIEKFHERGVMVEYGAFGENLVVEGFELKSLQIGTVLKIGEVCLELTQIGKACHDHCRIFQTTGDCIMPREGVFAKVIKGGTICPGEDIDLVPPDPKRPFTAAVITLSDRAFAGEYEDRSGPLVKEILESEGYEVIETLLLPDGLQPLSGELIRLSDQRQVNVIFTTGGTGFSLRDLTPEATAEVSDRMAPGISEVMRSESLKITRHAMLSRQNAGIRKRTLIVNLPGSPKACRENLGFILPALPHGLGILRGSEE